MKKYLASLLLSFFFFITSVFFITPVSANHIPEPVGHVNDFAGVLNAQQKSELEQELANYQSQTSNEIAVAFVKSLDGDDIDNFTVRAYEEWKIGQKGKDNGLLFLAAIEDHKMRIEVGYGLEPYLTDGQAGTIIRDTIAPYFKQNDYYGGTKAGISQIEDTISGESSTSTDIVQIPQTSRNIGKLAEFAVIFMFFAVPYFLAYIARSKSYWLGGVTGGGLGFILGLLASSLLLSSILLIIFGAIGLILDFVLSKTYQQRRDNGEPTDWWKSGGGFFPSGFGKGSSGSGFGGFGGGGSGGGGSSGGW
jgi:uncharacterized protein